jgi:CRISPR-associated endonuclease/helicase Cas3
VRDYAAKFAEEALGTGDLASDVTQAGWLHDIGKIDPRFQAVLHRGNEAKACSEAPLAKSGGRVSRLQEKEIYRKVGFPKGFRHEMASVQLVEENPGLIGVVHDVDLVKHIIEAHHGRCRPFAPYVNDFTDIGRVSLQHGQTLVTGSTRLAPPPNVVAERFWLLTDKYGWWGLAYLETLLRLADMRRSQDEQTEKLEEDKKRRDAELVK